MKKVLIITYYWPPGGGSGVRRWLNFSNLLHQHNWQPVIFRPTNAEYPSTDESLLRDIHPDTEIVGCPITEPYQLYAKFIGRKGNAVKPGVLFQDAKPGFKEKLSVWVRSNFFIPDAKMLWIRPANKWLTRYLKENPVDLVVSTGPPHTTHLIAMKVANRFGIPWIADFRDPWTEIDFFHQLKLTRLTLWQHKRLEHRVLTQSTAQLTVSQSWGRDLARLGARNVHVITNGFDEANFSSHQVSLDRQFTITHLGSINNDRNQTPFWQALRELIDENPQLGEKLSIKMIGDLVDAVKKDIGKYNLDPFCQFIPFMNHDDAMKAIASSRVLYLPLNNTPNVNGIIPGKVFEYLAVKRPILAIGPTDGDTAAVLNEASNGVVCNFGDKTKMKEALLMLFHQYEQGIDRIESDNYKKFSRSGLTQKLVVLMETLSSVK